MRLQGSKSISGYGYKRVRLLGDKAIRGKVRRLQDDMATRG